MELPLSLSLRDPYPVKSVNPLEVAPDPGEMGQMYIGAREAYEDGMTLACATPKIPYEEVKVAHLEQRQRPDFSNVDFFNEHFTVTPPDDESHVAKPGQTLDEYTLAIREKFIFPNTEQGHFDVWLPHPRSVAGAGRFGKHSFLWDGYQMAKGYAADERWDLVLNVIDNTEYQINRFGYALNGSADFYATRSQPDYFAHEVRMLADRVGPKALVRYLPAMEKAHKGYWMDGREELSKLPLDGQTYTHRALVRMPDGSFLNRYWDDGEGPRLESYKEDYELGQKVVVGLTGETRTRRLRKLYKDLRAGAASGWDYSSRWFKDGSSLETINTTDIIPVDHNSLMAYNEETLAMAYEAAAGMPGYDTTECLKRAEEYRLMVNLRVASINKYLFDSTEGMYRDYNFVDGHQTKIVSAAMAYPLYIGVNTDQHSGFGISDTEKSFAVLDAMERAPLIYPGGVIATTTEKSKEQWDGGDDMEDDGNGKRSKNVWAPPNWAAVRGLARKAHQIAADQKKTKRKTDVEPLLRASEKIRTNYMRGIEIAFKAHGIVPEKHRGDDPATLANGGEYALVKVLAMPSETWRAMKNLDPRDPTDHLPMGKLAAARTIHL